MTQKAKQPGREINWHRNVYEESDCSFSAFAPSWATERMWITPASNNTNLPAFLHQKQGLSIGHSTHLCILKLIFSISWKILTLEIISIVEFARSKVASCKNVKVNQTESEMNALIRASQSIFLELFKSERTSPLTRTIPVTVRRQRKFHVCSSLTFESWNIGGSYSGISLQLF